MVKRISRRDFLKLGALSFAGVGTLPFNPFPVPKDSLQYPGENIGRVTVSNKISIYSEPDWDSPTVGYMSLKDELVNLYYEVKSPKGPAYNPLWYRVWGGYIHSAYIQKVKFTFNQPLEKIPEGGQLSELTVPYSYFVKYDIYQGWQRFNRIYSETTHWITGIEEGPDKKPWYKVYDNGLEVLVPPEHLRPVPDEEMSPISPDVPWEEKRIEVNLEKQTLTAFERNQPVLTTNVSTGLPIRPDPDGIPWATPEGHFYVENKQPSTHMGDGRLTGDPEAYELPGVPWVLYFEPVTGVAFHGAYWHNNFGMQMSHGCVNMRPPEARWLFRWTYPVFKLPVKDRAGWEVRGRGTPVEVF